MPRNFYYRNEPDAVAGSASFAASIAADPKSFGLTPAQAASFGQVNDALQASFALATTPATRTVVAVARKNQDLQAMRTAALNLSRIVYATPAVSDPQLISLGLSPRPVRTPRAVPATPPSVQVLKVDGRTVDLRLNARGADRRGLPFGATGAHLYSFVGDQPPADSRGYHFEGLTTRAKTSLTFPATVASGATVWLSACWVGSRGQTSPFAAPRPFALQGGYIVPQTA